jgi:hypothetical protein
MPANTPAPWSLPYPLGTDRVMDGDDAIHSLGDALNARFARMWGRDRQDVVPIPPPGNNGWGGSAYYIIQSGWVWLNVLLTKPGWAAENILTLPTAIWPVQYFYFAGVDASTGAHHGLNITASNGILAISTNGAAGSGGVYASTSYPLRFV